MGIKFCLSCYIGSKIVYSWLFGHVKTRMVLNNKKYLDDSLRFLEALIVTNIFPSKAYTFCGYYINAEKDV